VSADVDERILTAAFELLRQHGIARLTVEAVAERSGVAKTTIYRRHRNAADVASAAIAHFDTEVDAATAGDGPRSALVAFLAAFGRKFEAVGLDVLGTMLAEPDGEVLTLHRERVVLPHRERVRQLLVAAQARGEVRADLDPLLVVELLVGSFFARHVAGRPMDVDAWAEAAVDLVWRGMAPAD
jgi:AcrR family transcriptional regulator